MSRGLGDVYKRQPRTYALHEDSVIDMAGIMADYEGRFSPVDTLYGSSVYAEMDPAYVYQVYRAQSGRLVRWVLADGSEAGDGKLTLEINKSCAGSPGLLEKASRHAERLVRDISG